MIKKITAFLFIFLSAFLVVCSFFSLAWMQASSYSTSLSTVMTDQVPVKEYIIRLKKDESLSVQQEKLKHILDDTDSYAAVYSHFSSSDDDDFVYDSFLYGPADLSLDRIYVSESNTLLLGDLKDGYLTSRRTDPDALGHLDFLDRFNLQQNAPVFRLYSIESEEFLEYLQNNKGFALDIASKNQSQIESRLQEEGFQVSSSYPIEQSNLMYVNEIQNYIPYVLFITVGACACMILNEIKKIRIMAVLGMGSAEIFYELFLKFYCLLSIACFLTISGTFLFLAGSIRPVTQSFLAETGKILVEILLLIVAVAFLTWLYILLSIRGFRENQKQLQKISGIMVMVLLVCLTSLIPSFDQSSWNFLQDLQQFSAVTQNRNEILSYAALGALSGFDTDPESEKTISALLREANVIYQECPEVINEYSDPHYHEMIAMGFRQLNAAQVNLNWVKDSGFIRFLTDSAPLDEDTDYLLIPEALKEDTASILATPELGLVGECIPVYYQTNQSVLSLNFFRSPLLHRNLLIHVHSKWLPSEHQVSFSGNGSYYLKKDSAEYSELQEQLTQNDLEDLWIDRETQYAAYENQLKEDLVSDGINLILTLLIVVVLLYAVVRIYLVENEKLSFIKTVTGDRLADAVFRFILRILPAYLLASIWLIWKQEWKQYTVIWVLGLFLLQTALFILMYKKWQKKDLQLLLREE